MSSSLWFAPRTNVSADTLPFGSQTLIILKASVCGANHDNLIDTDKPIGTWRHSRLIARGDTHLAAGNKAAARAAFQVVLDDPKAEQRHRQAATERLNDLK